MESPWPRTVGLGLPFAAAGAGGMIGNIIRASGSPAEQDRAARVGCLAGFAAGACFYLIALARSATLSSVKPSVSKAVRSSMVMGAVTGIVLSLLGAGVSITYDVVLVEVAALVIYYVGPPDRSVFGRRSRR